MFSAEYGHVSGAIVNLVTRSGTNRIAGEAYEFRYRDPEDRLIDLYEIRSKRYERMKDYILKKYQAARSDPQK